MSWYAVYPGHRPGIYSEWYGPFGALEASSEYPGEQHQKFDTFQEALDWCVNQIIGSATDRHRPEWVEPGETDGIQVEVAQDGSDGAGESNVDGDQAEVGHWGEDNAFRALIKQLSEQYGQSNEFRAIVEKDRCTLLAGETSLAELVWRNAPGESGSSPDLTLTEKERKKSIEVKTTRLRTARIRLTRAEYELALKEGQNYCLAVVRQAMTPEVNITAFWDPVRKFGLKASIAAVGHNAKESVKQAPVQLKEPGPRTSTFKDGYVRDAAGRTVCHVGIQIDTPGAGRIFLCRRMGRHLVFVKDQAKLIGMYGEALASSRNAKPGLTDIFLSIKGGYLHEQVAAIKAALSQ